MLLFNFIAENWIFLIIIFLVLFFYLMINFSSNKYSELKEFSKTESPIEEFLFEEIRKRVDKRGFNYQVYSQVECGPYRIDLALYTNKGKIAIECDGKDYHTAVNFAKNDKNKNFYLNKRGWTVFRFTGSEIYRNREKCVDEIIEYIERKKILHNKKTAHIK